ncbi:hypothetical protein GLAREA_03197 [Glarea lozoyensis ATCC 20868]|uniref:Uncharacterized protein n=1 Tax=Glarea lozoyensis (strain ATCC 20868 / MF5171) TaxID=1116229 RepID=S3CLE2_GLAL2|nr:uncharacterized protein GLAREA_03197 [Glarea lozoyensis ATCC 20868]EPE27282.1 hypothetical protein GLAREA_03197 [Glarea lozoyensis ATCC 20868]
MPCACSCITATALEIGRGPCRHIEQTVDEVETQESRFGGERNQTVESFGHAAVAALVVVRFFPDEQSFLLAP